MAIDYGTVIDGAARSDNINTSGLTIDMEAQTALLQPNSYPFEALLRQIGKKVMTDQMKHEYRERRPIPGYATLTGAAAVGDTTLTIANDYTRIKNDYLLYAPSTGEMFLVQDTSIDSTVAVVRLSGSGAIQNAIAANAVIMVLGESHAEGEEVPTAVNVKSINKFNYVMQKDRRIQVTDIEEASKHYDSSEERTLARKCAFIEYKRDEDLLFYVGQGSRETTSGDGRRHCCSGLIERLTENNYDLTGTDGLTIETLASILGATKYYGAAGEKMGIFGNNAWQAVSAWPKEALRVSPMAKTWGIEINEILTGFGKMSVMYDPMLDAKYGLEDRAFIVDTSQARQLQMNGLPVKMILAVPNLSTTHQTVDVITGTFGLQVKFEELHAQISGCK